MNIYIFYLPVHFNNTTHELLFRFKWCFEILKVAFAGHGTRYLRSKTLLWQQTIADLIQPTCWSDGKEKEAERQRARITGRRGFMWKIYAASETFFTDSWSWQSFSHLVMFLPVFLHWVYKMKYSCYQHSFVILGWFVYWVVRLKNAPLDKKKSEIIVSKNKLLLVSLLHLAKLCETS